MRQTYQETHKKILDYLFELGQKKGLTNVKVTDITKGLRINRDFLSTLFRYTRCH